MDWGMANRLSQIIQKDGHVLIMPVDHGYFQGPTRKLEEPHKTIEPLLPYSDALFITRGVLRACVDPDNTKPIILRVSGGTSMAGKDLANEGITTSIEEAIRLNVAAVGISIFVGTDYEKESLLNLAKLVNEGERYGIPVMAVTAVGRELEKRDGRYLGLASRIAAELGARVVKTYWCEDFEQVSRGCPVPVIMAGGPQVDTELEVFSFVHNGMQKGAIGVNLGRNIWQNDYPVAMIKAIRAIVHENRTPQEALEIYEAEKVGAVAGQPAVGPPQDLWTLCLSQLRSAGLRIKENRFATSVFGPGRGRGKVIMRMWRKKRFPITVKLENPPTPAGRLRIRNRKDWEQLYEKHLKPRIGKS